jgi:hypothetical protein
MTVECFHRVPEPELLRTAGNPGNRVAYQGDRTILTRLLILSHSAFSAAPTKTPHERRRAQARAPEPGRVSTPVRWGRQPSAAARRHEPACPAPALPHWPQCFRSWAKTMVWLGWCDHPALKVLS